MRTHHLLAGVLAAAAVVSGCATGTPTSGSAEPAGAVAPAPAAPASGRATESREVRGFTGVELRAVGSLQIEQTGTESLTIEADAEVLPQLTSTVSGGVLELGVARGTEITTKRRVVYRLTVATLDSITVSGVGDATAPDLRTDRLNAEISGAGRLKLGGTADSLVVTISGTGDYDGENLQSTAAEVTIRSAGNAVVRVSDRLDATVGGVGSVEYIGDPRVTTEIRGVGSVEQR